MISEFPLFVFTTLGGLAAGAYAVSVLFPAVMGDKKGNMFVLACGLLLAVGLVALPTHLGNPLAAWHAVLNPAAAMAQEAYWSGAFGICVLIDFILRLKKGESPRGVQIAGAIFAIGLSGVMAFAYHEIYAIQAWHSPLTYLLFIVGNLAMGATLLAVFKNELLQNKTYKIAVIVLTLAAAVVLAAELSNFGAFGLQTDAFILGAVAAVVAALIAWMNGKMKPAVAAWLIFILMFVGMACARYYFYLAVPFC